MTMTIESPLLEHLGGYIDGRWAAADSGKTLAVTNPATGDKLADVASMGAAETNRAIEAAARAADAPSPSLAQRRAWLEQLDELHMRHKEAIARIVTQEHGKPIKEARGEVEYSAGFYRYCAKHIDQLQPRVLDEKPRDCTWTVHYRPMGVVALLTPWNFPIAMLAKKFCSAVAAGCPSITKPSSKTPLTIIAMFALIDEHMDMPPGFANMVIGSAGPISDAIMAHRAVAAVSLTGSTGVGQELIRKSADTVKRMTLELGGNAPFIVFEDADVEYAADQLLANKFRSAGQTCVCSNRIFVHRSVVDRFVDLFAERVRKLKVGNGMNEDTDIGPLIDAKAYNKVRAHVEDAIARGAKRVVGEDIKPLDGDYGAFFPPTVLRDVTDDMTCSCDETFGPLAPILSFDDEAEVVRRANAVDMGLAGYVFTADEKRAERVIAKLHYGHVGWNTGTGPTSEAPFGGMKQSGYGREGGMEGLFDFTEPQAVPRGR
jgi:succinate-semialdehyde dehydrogenase/glutarate-semialdehyde dehydrogenase